MHGLMGQIQDTQLLGLMADASLKKSSTASFPSPKPKMLLSGLPEIVGDDEVLARFLTSSSHFNSRGVRHTVFLPEPNDRETSVFRHNGVPPEELWAMARDRAAQGRTIHGAALVTTDAVRLLHLEVTAAEPPPRHAAIRNWPWIEDDPELRKAHHKNLAMSLASKAELILRTAI